MTEMHPNEVLLRESYEALERGDWDALRNMLAEDFVLVVAGRNPLAGETRGRDANIARQQRLIKLLGGQPYHTEHIDTAVSGDRVFDYARVTYDLGGKSFTYTTVNVWRFEDGKIKEARGHIFDLYAWDDLWTAIAAPPFSEMTLEGNKTVARRFFDEVVSNGNLEVVDELCSPAYRVYATLSGPDAIDVTQMKELVTSFRSSFPDARITIEDMAAEGDLVAARMMEEGTHAGEFKGIPPTGRRVTYGSMTFLRVVNGKIVEHWGLLDMPSLLQQIGSGPSSRSAESLTERQSVGSK